MTICGISLALIFLLGIGFVKVFKYYKKNLADYHFAIEYREKFINFSNKYINLRQRFNRTGAIDNDLYVWLTMNVNKIQNNLGNMGILDYTAPFQRYHIRRYQVIINSLPKFRDDSVDDFDINSVDDCLLRYIGVMEGKITDTTKNLKNPIIWFRIGITEIITIPLLLFNWLGIFSRQTFYKIKESILFKLIAGLISLVTLVSGCVTIILGTDQTIEFIQKLLNR